MAGGSCWRKLHAVAIAIWNGSGGGGFVPDQIREEDAIALLKPLMEAPGVLKIGHDVKFGMQVFAHRSVTVAPVEVRPDIASK